MGRGIPDRWDAYSAFGTIIRGTRFLPFKVPLKKALCKDLPGDQKFTPRILVDRVKGLQLSQPQEQPLKLGLVIDLTNTSRYYDPKEITKHNVKYEKICIKGCSVPAASVRRRFNDVVSQFLKENSNNGLLVGVHCTHGVNRTGYLVCRYMIDCMQANPADAVRAFNEGRGHAIERENYLKHLATVSSASDLAAEMEASPAASLPQPPPPPGAAECVQPPHSQSRLQPQEHRARKKPTRQQQQQSGRCPDDERRWVEHEEAVHSRGGLAAWQPPRRPGTCSDSLPPPATGPDCRVVEPPPHRQQCFGPVTRIATKPELHRSRRMVKKKQLRRQLRVLKRRHAQCGSCEKSQLDDLMKVIRRKIINIARAEADLKLRRAERWCRSADRE